MPKAKRANSTPRSTASRRDAAADPIFALIDAHNKAHKLESDLYDAIDKAEDKAAKKYGRMPLELVAWRNYTAIGGSEIEEVRDTFKKLPAIDPKKIDAEYRKVKAKLRSLTRQRLAWDRRAGLTTLRRDIDRANVAERRAALKMASFRPKTLAGIAALVDCVKTDLGQESWHEMALDTIAAALRALQAQGFA